MTQQALSLVSGGPFEGEIAMSTSEPGKPPHSIVYLVKGTKMRFDLPTGPGGMTYGIFDASSKKVTSVNDTQKTAMVIDLSAAAASPLRLPPTARRQSTRLARPTRSPDIRVKSGR